MHLESGDRLGRYEILSFLGKGGMGEVYRARDSELDREVAIKVLPEEVAADSTRLSRFRREAKAVAKLSHASILEIFDFGRQGEVTFAVTELLEGESLRETLDAEKGGLPPEKARDIAAAVADGLAVAHAKGVVHRDIKPGNLFRCSDGRIKILDFGLASLRGPVSDEATTASLGPAVSAPGTILGTVGYMSPEQVRGEEVDHRSDIFSLGCVFYEMLTGRRPFQRDTSVETMTAILREEPPSLNEAGVEVGDEMEKALSRCLEKEPGNRFQSASDLASDLKSIPTDQAIRRPDSQEKIEAPSSEESPNSIAILPLRNLTGDSEQAYFVDGLHEELISTFARISAFDKVIARTSVLGFRDAATPIREIGGQLGVALVLEGSVRRSGNTVRATLQLMDADSEDHLWVNSFERDLTDILALQSDVARAVAEEIELALTPREESRLARAPQVDPETYEAYLKGIYHTYKLTPPELDAGQHYFERALELDPDYALAHAGISFVWTARQQMGLLIPSEATPRAKAAAQRALELDDTLPEVHFMWAAIKTWNDWDWRGGEQSFKRALGLRPNYAEALVYYSNLLCYMDRLDEAVEMAERALQLDPLNSITLTISACTLSYLRRYDDAIERYQFALGTSPNDPVAHNGLWENYYAKGMYEESLQSAKAFFTGLGFSEIAEVMAQGYEEGGYSGAMRCAAEAMEAFSKQTYVSSDAIARMYAFAGDKEKTIEWLETGYEMRDPMMPYVSAFPYDLLDDDPRYRDLLRRMDLPEDQ
jgi:serine/threonine-protein kinase